MGEKILHCSGEANHQHCDGRWSYQCDRCQIGALDQEYFRGMISHSGSQIEVRIGMMHLVDTPQHRNPVKEVMHAVSKKIQQDHRDDETQCERRPRAIQQAVGALGNQHGDHGCAERKDGVHADVGESDQSVARPSACIRQCKRSPRAKRLDQGDQHKCRNQQPPSDTNFVAGEVLLHSN